MWGASFYMSTLVPGWHCRGYHAGPKGPVCDCQSSGAVAIAVCWSLAAVESHPF